MSNPIETVENKWFSVCTPFTHRKLSCLALTVKQWHSCSRWLQICWHTQKPIH